MPLLLAAVVVVGAMLPAAASASFHLMNISAVFGGDAPGEGYVQLQMYAAGQTQLTGTSVTIYDAAGTVAGTHVLANNAPNGASQRTYLIAGGSFAGASDETGLGTALFNNRVSGAACFDGAPPDLTPVDCVSWGSFVGDGSLPGSGAGTPDPAQISANPLVRDVGAGCASALDASDDTNDSAFDFLAGPGFVPADNGSAPHTLACPQTKITDGPKKETSKAKATFKFKSNQANSVFECKLDKGDFDTCDSPASFRVKPGKHALKVRATNPLEGVDATPDSYRWKRI